MDQEDSRVSRRSFFKLGTVAAGAAAAAGVSGAGVAGAAPSGAPAASGVSTANIGAAVYEQSIADLQAAMTAGRTTARALVKAYLERIAKIDQSGPKVNAVIEVNPDAYAIAAALDAERAAGRSRGPLHGIPIIIKDNIDTDDKMLTTAGSLAMVGTRPAQDATVAKKLRDAGAIILGKANLSEWANFRSTQSSSGWSGRGRQTRNPYALDRNPCGSSSGSAAAVAASLCAASLGSETDGSIVCPSSLCGVVGIKPTVGLTSRAGVIPIAETQDTVGPHGRSVADAAAVLGALTGVDPRDPYTAASAGRSYTDYTQFLNAGGLRGARIGVQRNGGVFGYSPETDKIIEGAIGALRGLGAIIVDPVELPEAAAGFAPEEFTVLLYEFKDNLNKYLATRLPNPAYRNVPVMRSLADLIAFNKQIKDVEMPYFGQELFEIAETFGPLTEQAYLDALKASRDVARQGIDKTMDDLGLDAIVMPTGQPAWPTDVISGDHFLGASSSAAARAGYPLISVPAGDSFGLPIGITFMGRAWSEPTLIRLAYAFEQGTKTRRPPQYWPTLPLP